MRLFVLFLVVCGIEACTQPAEACCETDEPVPPLARYVIAGHAYGNPGSPTNSIYPSFIQALRAHMENVQVDGLILTGDVVVRNSDGAWDSTKMELDGLGIPWYIAPGNHDLSPYFLAEIQPAYQQFEVGSHQFILLNTNYPGWTVDSLQHNFIQTQLEHLSKESVLFVFSHQLWWLNNPPEEMEIDSIRPNSYASFEGPSSFWTDVWPLVKQLEIEVYFVAGDLGCDPAIASWYEDHFRNFHFYASGMGGGENDNFIDLVINSDGSVKLKRMNF